MSVTWGTMEVGTESSTSTGVSPRISFSHDLSQADTSELPAAAAAAAVYNDRLDFFLAPSDFDFSLGADVSSSDSFLADDLFSDGKLLPLPIRNPTTPSPSPSIAPPSAAPPEPTSDPFCRKRGSLREVMAISDDDDAGDGIFLRPSSQKPFWRFRRSTSLNFGGGKGGSGLCPFPLLRSKSSGSSSPIQVRPSPKQSDNGSHATNAACVGPLTELLKRSPNESRARIYYYSANSRGPHGNAVRISPVINVPTPSSMGIFSFLLCKRGDKSMAKSSPVIYSP